MNGNPTTRQPGNLRVAFAHDFLNQYGGAERVLEVLCGMFPKAPIYTLLYDKEKMKGKFSGRVIHASFLQKFPKLLRRNFKWLLPLLPTAPETFDFREYDLVISSSGAWSKGIVTRLNTVHVSYIHSPMRFVWDYNERYLKEDRKEKLGFLVRPVLSYFRLWDKLAADRPDYLIANSKYTQARIEKYYRRKSEVIYPPISIPSQLSPERGERGEYFLIVSRLSAYKNIDKAVEAFNKLGLPLVVAGTGKQEKYLKSIAGKNVKFEGWVGEKRLQELYGKARAFVFPGEDDFGMAPVEAMSYGVPVIALKKGGARETVEEGKTGEFFEASTPEVIADGVRRFMENEADYDRECIRKSAERFERERFIREMEIFINQVLSL